MVKPDGTYEIIDGQQRTMSICEYVQGNTQYGGKFFNNLSDEKRQAILNYTLSIYFCEGTSDERLDWFRTINIAGICLTRQELLNASFTSPWLVDAKKFFSKTRGPAYRLGSEYIDSSKIPNRQDYLELVISWFLDTMDEKKFMDYMGECQAHKTDATELKDFFKAVIGWVQTTFPNSRPNLMRGINWARLYRTYKNIPLDPVQIEVEIVRLLDGDKGKNKAEIEIQNPKGIYEYVLDHNELHLRLRTFSERTKRLVYTQQGGRCVQCGKVFKIDEMDADHIIPWSKGGETIQSNCQLLCRHCNQMKSNK